MSSSTIIQPIPRRSSFEPSQFSVSRLKSPGLSDSNPSRTHSTLNLTSSTLLGIFSPSEYDTEPETVSSPGTQTPLKSPIFSTSPVRVHHHQPRPSRIYRLLDFTIRFVLLFAAGIGYGTLIQLIFNEQQLNPIQVKNLAKEKSNWIYLILWGILGVALGSLLPLLDTYFYIDMPSLRSSKWRSTSSTVNLEAKVEKANILYDDWSLAVRSMGAFVGIAFAIRKLPWSSTFQASLALSVVNPVLWYVIDRSKSGFLLSSTVGAVGTTLLLISKTKIMISFPSRLLIKTPNAALNYSGMSNEAMVSSIVSWKSIEDTIWILSVLFCSSVCFGNIGRRLALNKRK